MLWFWHASDDPFHVNVMKELNSDMKCQPTSLPDVILLLPQRFSDARGWFSETWSSETLASLGMDISFVQDNHSYSAAAGTLRGLHYQRSPYAQDKLVRCTRGAIWDVAVDMRRGSPNFGCWVGVDLTPENSRQLLIPKGFLHGFVTREPHSEVQYKCTNYFAPECDGAVRWNDPDLAIDWGLNGTTPVLSDKDMAAPAFQDVPPIFDWDHLA